MDGANNGTVLARMLLPLTLTMKAGLDSNLSRTTRGASRSAPRDTRKRLQSAFFDKAERDSPTQQEQPEQAD
jgi:hypothetical protein